MILTLPDGEIRELEYYTKDNVSVSDGNLNIIMKKQSKEFSENDPTKEGNCKYSSENNNSK